VRDSIARKGAVEKICEDCENSCVWDDSGDSGRTLDGEEGLRSQEGFDSGEDFSATGFGDGSLESCAASGLLELVGDLLHADEKERSVGKFFGETLGGLKSVHHRHGEVENDEVRMKLGGFFNGIFSIGSVSADFPELVGFENSAQQEADGLVVIGNQDANWHE
jgi:hypothetical protein